MAASIIHSAVQVNLAYELRKLTDYRIHTALTILIDEVEYKPDLSVYPYKALDKKHDIIRMKELPLLAIEIVSPTQLPQAIVTKIEAYLQAGIKSCWLVLPYPTTVTVYNPKGEKTIVEGNVVDETLKIELPINNIFF